MIAATILLALLGLMALAGITGVGARDSRDASFGLGATPRLPRCADENLLVVGHPRRMWPVRQRARQLR